jgi:c-di-GMP-binding flagellar brake protein YcgR
MGASVLGVLAKGIEEKLPALVSARWNGSPVQLHVRLIDDAGDEGFWVEVLDGPKGFIQQAVQFKTEVEVSFLLKDSVVLFESSVISMKKRLWSGKLLLMKPPERVSVMERRGNNREAVPDDMEVTALVAGWGKTTARVWDLSSSGAGLLCPLQLAMDLEKGQELRVKILRRGQEIVVVAQVCSIRSLSKQTARVGVRMHTVDADSQALLSTFLTELANLRVTRTLRGDLGGQRIGMVA